MTELEHAITHIKTRADAWAVKEVTEALQSISERLDKALSQESIDCANAEHDADGCLGYSTDRGGYSYCQTCLECPKASINNRDKEQEPCTDAVSREAVCDYIAEFVNNEYSTQAECDMVDLMIKGIKHLPSVTQKSGHWIETEYHRWRCSVCREKGMSEWDNIHDVRTNFCPDCGAKMESDEKKRDTDDSTEKH